MGGLQLLRSTCTLSQRRAELRQTENSRDLSDISINIIARDVAAIPNVFYSIRMIDCLVAIMENIFFIYLIVLGNRIVKYAKWIEFCEIVFVFNPRQRRR